MGQTMVGRLAIKAKQIQPGDAFAAAVPAGGLVEIVDLEGRQVAELVAFDQADPAEQMSLGVTRHRSRSIMLSLGMTLYSSRGRAMLDLIEDTVGRHDLLWAAPTGPVEEPGAALPAEEHAAGTAPTLEAVATDLPSDDQGTLVSTSGNGSLENAPSSAGATSADVARDGLEGTTMSAQSITTTTVDAASNGMTQPAPTLAATRPATVTARSTGFAAALEPFGLSTLDAPDPVNFFMQLAVMQKGDLELRTPLSERGDRVVLKALTDLIVAVRCSAATDETNADNPTDILVRIYR